MSNTKYDSEFCGSLPIHLINLIQPYGALVVVEENTNVIVQISENAGSIFGTSLDQIVGKRLEAFISQESLNQLKKKFESKKMDQIPATWKINGRRYLTMVHRKDDLLLIEIDQDDYNEGEDTSFVAVYQELKYAMELIQTSTSVEEIAVITARELKRISGFDKVMVYRFDKDWNGTVIAEELEEGMEAYNGFTFPASDVPASARRLYLKNPYRFIPNREYQPVKLFPVINPVTQSFLDLSGCNVRAVASVHLEYLKNMRVSASMSTRILMGGSLWGLIACHHRVPMTINFELRSIFELVSNVVSAKMSSLQNEELHRLDSALKENYKSIIEEAYKENNLSKALLNGSPDLLTLFSAKGVAISKKGKVYSKGLLPDEEALNEFILWLHTRQLKGVFDSDSISEHYDGAEAFKEKASGVLVIPVDPAEDEYVVMFRPEVIRSITWGGNPEERIQFEEDRRTYHPRNSFRQWMQKVEGRSLPWRREEVAMAENLRSFIHEFTG